MSAPAPADARDMLPSPLALNLFAVAVGAALGSAVTAIVHRVPRGISWVKGRSACPGCGRTLAPIDLVPVLSFAWSRGRCRQCGARIGWRYPIIELACVAWSVLLLQHVGWSVAYALLLPWGCLLVALTWIDYDFQLLPDVLTLTGTLLGLGYAFVVPRGIHSALLGLVAGSVAIWVVAWAYRRVRGAEGLGAGDIKLAAMFGVVLGPALTLLTLLLAAFAGTLWGVALIAQGRGHGRTELPFGTLLAPCAMLALLWGDRVVSLYLGLFHRA